MRELWEWESLPQNDYTGDAQATGVQGLSRELIARTSFQAAAQERVHVTFDDRIISETTTKKRQNQTKPQPTFQTVGA